MAKAKKKATKSKKGLKWRDHDKVSLALGVHSKRPMIALAVSPEDPGRPSGGYIVSLWDLRRLAQPRLFGRATKEVYGTREEAKKAAEKVKVTEKMLRTYVGARAANPCLGLHVHQEGVAPLLAQLAGERTKRNPTEAQHRKQARVDLKRAEQDYERAAEALRDGTPGVALSETALSLAAASMARCEAENGNDPAFSRKAAEAMRRAGDQLLAEVEEIQSLTSQQVLATATASNPDGRTFPTGDASFMIRAYSGSLLSGNDDIWLVITSEGEVMDAIVALAEDFGPVEIAGYGNLATLEIEVSAAQYRQLHKLAEQLEQVTTSRPVFRPSPEGSSRRDRPGALQRMPPAPGPTRSRGGRFGAGSRSTRYNGDVVAMTAPGIAPATNRELVRQGWKPHRELMSTGAPKSPGPKYSLYRRKLSEGEWAYLRPHHVGRTGSTVLDKILVLEVLGTNDRLYSDNVHDPSDATDAAEELAAEIRKWKDKPENLQGHQYLFSRPKPTPGDDLAALKRRLL